MYIACRPRTDRPPARQSPPPSCQPRSLGTDVVPIGRTLCMGCATPRLGACPGIRPGERLPRLPGASGSAATPRKKICARNVRCERILYIEALAAAGALDNRDMAHVGHRGGIVYPSYHIHAAFVNMDIGMVVLSGMRYNVYVDVNMEENILKSGIFPHLLRSGARDCAQRVHGRDLVDVHVLLDAPTRDAIDRIISVLWSSTPRRLSRSEVVREIVAWAAAEVAADAADWASLPDYDRMRRLCEIAAETPSPRPIVRPWGA